MKNIRQWFVLSAILAVPLLLPVSTAGAEKDSPAGDYYVYIGTYTRRSSKGIYVYRFNAASGRLTSLGLAVETVNPSFLAVDPTHHFLYAVNELGNYEGPNSGGVSAFAIEPHTGKLTFLNEVRSRGAAPCYVSLDKTGKYVLVANYGGGSVAVFPVLKDGRLGEPSAFVQHQGHSVNPARQRGPHAHCINVSPDNRFALASDLGLDKLLVYRFDAAKGTLTPDNPPFGQIHPGWGPRHFVFSPDGKFVYAISEIGCTMSVFSYDAATGALHPVQAISTLPKDFKGKNDDAEVQVSASGKFLYGSNRGADTIAVFAIDPTHGTLTPIEYVPTGGKEPRNFAIDPSGRYLFAANQNSNNIVLFRIDPKTGRLSPTGTVEEVGSPVCVTFAPIK
jgi:6-phosphogluconolactonase